jgi:hypothetical protein
MPPPSVKPSAGEASPAYDSGLPRASRHSGLSSSIVLGSVALLLCDTVYSLWLLLFSYQYEEMDAKMLGWQVETRLREMDSGRGEKLFSSNLTYM